MLRWPLVIALVAFALAAAGFFRVQMNQTHIGKMITASFLMMLVGVVALAIAMIA